MRCSAGHDATNARESPTKPFGGAVCALAEMLAMIRSVLLIAQHDFRVPPAAAGERCARFLTMTLRKLLRGEQVPVQKGSRSQPSAARMPTRWIARRISPIGFYVRSRARRKFSLRWAQLGLMEQRLRSGESDYFFAFFSSSIS